MKIPRPYQSEAVNLLRDSLGTGHRRPILQLPTGSGKTFVSAMIIRLAQAKGKRVLFLAPRRELIYQASRAFSGLGIANGMIMAGERCRAADVMVASFQTLYVRGKKTNWQYLPDVDFLIVDECHLSITKSYQDLLSKFGDKFIIGLTATPARGDGKGLGACYDDLISATSIRDLTEQGYLCPVRYFAPNTPDLEGLKLVNGDYREKELGKVMDQPELIGDIVQNWLRLARDKKTVVFCSTKAHGRHVCQEFLQAGIAAEHIDSDTPNEERQAILKRIESGETQVVTNVFVMSYGLDIPSLACAVLARPTQNITLYLQTVGRVLRTCPGKTEALVIDHSGAVAANGFVDDYIPWSLESKQTIKEKMQKAKEEAREPKEITCSECGSLFKGQRVCPTCDHELIPKTQAIPVHQANLQEIERDQDRAGKKANRTWSWEAKIDFIGQLKAYCASKGYSSGWVAHKYREKFGVWPTDPRLKNAPLTDIGAEVKGFIKHQAIARRKVGGAT